MDDVEVASRVTAEKPGEVERVYQLLKNWLIDCVLEPGSYLSEVELARRCQTSRTPVREACNRLSQERWIDRIRNKGYRVRPVSVREILELYEFRRVIECFAAEKVAQVATAPMLEALAEIIAVENAMQEPGPEFLAANERFHLKMAELSGNPLILAQLKLTLEYVHRIDKYSQTKSLQWLPHGQILRALAAHDAAASREAMAVHIDMSRDRMLKLFGS